jgi:hypothetical protein
MVISSSLGKTWSRGWTLLPGVEHLREGQVFLVGQAAGQSIFFNYIYKFAIDFFLFFGGVRLPSQ